MNRRVIILSVILLSVFFMSCSGNRIHKSIKKLEGNKDERENAMMELVLAKENAIEPLIKAFSDTKKPSSVRVDIVTILFRIYLRESDERILPALLTSIKDSDPKIRETIVAGLGDVRDKGVISKLQEMLEDNDSQVKYQALCSLKGLKEKMDETQKGDFIKKIELFKKDKDKLIKEKAKEILAERAKKIMKEAEKYVLKAEITKAEDKFMEARTIVPDNLNVNYGLGRFYYDQGEKEKGLKILEEYGLVTYVKKIDIPPVIDGELSDPCWKEVKPINRFYKCLRNIYLAKETEGKSELYLGYTEDAFYIGTKGYEDSTTDLVRSSKTRDSQVWRDDCWEIFLDTSHDYRTLYQIVVNCIGAVYDSYERRRGEWNGEYKVGTKIRDKFWSMEIKIPFKELHDTKVEKGTVWGFNITRFRAYDGESCQWVPTYGSHHRPDLFGFLIFD